MPQRSLLHAPGQVCFSTYKMKMIDLQKVTELMKMSVILNHSSLGVSIYFCLFACLFLPPWGLASVARCTFLSYVFSNPLNGGPGRHCREVNNLKSTSSLS